MKSIFVINPGSTSTRLAVFSFDDEQVDPSRLEYKEIERIDLASRDANRGFMDDLDNRWKIVSGFLKKVDKKIGQSVAAVGRGGILKPLKGGVYRVNDEMIDDLVSCRYGIHASNMGAPLARYVAARYNIDAYIAYPVSVDELDDIARYTGMPEIKRRSYFHALNQKTVARRVCRDMGKAYEKVNLIVAHLGGGISVGLHVCGQVVDVNNALDGDGPFSIERAGGIPAGDLMRMCFSKRYTYGEMYERVVGKGGIYSYLGTKDARILDSIISGKITDHENKTEIKREVVKKVIDACIYQVAKNICALASYTCGEIDGIILTGGLAHFHYFVTEIEKRVLFLSKVFILPGEEEMKALCESVLRAKYGIEKIYEYRSER